MRYLSPTMIASVLLCLASDGGALSQRSPNERLDVPPEAREVAVKGLEHWKETVARQPGTFGLEGMEQLISGARLEGNYMRYRLTKGDIEEYVKSDKGDPTGFAQLRAYVFPIYSDGVYLGGIRVRYRDRFSTPAEVAVGNYSLVGVDALDNGVSKKTSLVLDASAANDFRFVGWVQFMVVRMDLYFIVERGADRLFVPSKCVTEAFVSRTDVDALRMTAATEQGMEAVKRVLAVRLAEIKEHSLGHH